MVTYLHLWETKIFHEWVKLRRVDLEILGGSYNATHLSDFGDFKNSPR